MLNTEKVRKNLSLNVFLMYLSTQLPTIILLNHLHQSSLQLLRSDKNTERSCVIVQIRNKMEWVQR